MPEAAGGDNATEPAEAPADGSDDAAADEADTDDADMEEDDMEDSEPEEDDMVVEEADDREQNLGCAPATPRPDDLWLPEMHLFHRWPPASSLRRTRLFTG